MAIEIGVVIAVIGCIVGVMGYFAGRDKKIAYDSEWRGMVNAKLDIIVGIKSDVDTIQRTIMEHEGRITAVESSLKSLHKRLDGEQR